MDFFFPKKFHGSHFVKTRIHRQQLVCNNNRILNVYSLSDVMADIRETATKLWDDIGLQYMDENEEDLKKKSDFLKDVPTHYPDVKRPNLGCMVLVQTNIGKIVPAIGRGDLAI